MLPLLNILRKCVEAGLRYNMSVVVTGGIMWFSAMLRVNSRCSRSGICQLSLHCGSPIVSIHMDLWVAIPWVGLRIFVVAFKKLYEEDFPIIFGVLGVWSVCFNSLNVIPLGIITFLSTLEAREGWIRLEVRFLLLYAGVKMGGPWHVDTPSVRRGLKRFGVLSIVITDFYFVHLTTKYLFQ